MLSLYRLPQKARKQLLLLLEKLKDRLWVPHHVAMEYYRKRPEVIHDQERVYEAILKALKGNEDSIASLFNQYPKHPFIDGKKI